MSRLSHTATELTGDLRRMGVRAGSVVMVHSSMKSIGHVAGGPEAVVRALKSAVTSAGTILMPAFTYSLDRVYEKPEPFDAATSPAQTGLIPETFRRSAGVLRSAHPTHSVAAWGRDAARYAEGHEGRSAFDPETPLHRAAEDRALVLMVGCDFTSLSLLHVAEAVAEVPYLGVFCWWHAGWKPDALRRRRGGATERVRYPSVPGCSGSFGALQVDAERKGIVRRASLGNAEVLVFRADEVLELAVSRLRRNPDALLCPPATCPACDERRVIFQGRTPAARRVRSFFVEVIPEVGIRVAGSPEERHAADLIAARFRSLGLSEAQVQEFPIPAWEPGYASLEVRLREERKTTWRAVPCAPCSHAPATPSAGIERELVNVESLADLAKLGDGRGRIAVLWDGYGASERELRGLMARGFSAFIYVDRRFSHDDRVSVGFPGGWVRHISAPMVSVPFPEAARLFGHGARARLRVTGSTRSGTSWNAIAQIPGTGDETIVVCAHHDSTFNSVAVDDNLTGVAAMLEIARALTKVRGVPRRTVRFCSFGAEELLSEGSRAYALVSGGARNVCFVLNNDSMGARVGSTDVCVTGPAELGAWLRRRAGQVPLQFRVGDEISPFSDHFPFNAAGVPSLWFYRPTLTTGRHFHHTTRDSLAGLSLDLVADMAAFQASLVRELAFAARLPFPASLPPLLAARISRAAEEWLGYRSGASGATQAARSGRVPPRGRA